MTYTGTITSKRQLTIPAELFRRAGLSKGEKVIFNYHNGSLGIESAAALVERLAGSVPLPKRFRDLAPDQIIDRAKREYFRRPI